MIIKTIWLACAALVIITLVALGLIGVSVTPVVVEKEVQTTQLPQ